MHREGHSLEDDGEWDEAEAKFREALAGCQVLLSPIHEHTRIYIYGLAEFYAQHDRMKDAYVLLDWMTDRILSKAAEVETFLCHLLKIAELLRRWSRLEDAKVFGMQLIQLVRTIHAEQIISAADISATIPHVSKSQSVLTGTLSNQGLQNLFMPLSTQGVADPSESHDRNLIDSQLSLALVCVEANDKEGERFLMAIIDQCRYHPTDLMAQSLKAWTGIVDLYRRLGKTSDMTAALLQTREILVRISKSDYRKSKSLPKVAIETAKLYFNVGKDDMGAEILSRVECRIADAFDDEVDITCDLLIGIGVWFQDKERWRDARPRFERALALALAEHGVKCKMVKQLELTLEHHYYTPQAKRPCECFEVSDEDYGSCMLWSTKTSTGMSFNKKECDLELMDT